MPRQCLATICVLATVALGALTGCGSDSSDGGATVAERPAAAAPALATRPAGPGEFVVRGQGSPATHGPYEFAGRYLVRFEQYAPEDAALDFAGQTPFEATLTPREGDPRGAIKLFSAARTSGRREMKIDGRLFAEVSFGDFPYVLRFTPRSG